MHFMRNNSAFLRKVAWLTLGAFVVSACTGSTNSIRHHVGDKKARGDIAILENPDHNLKFIAIIDGRSSGIPLWERGKKYNIEVNPGPHSVVVHDEWACGPLGGGGDINPITITLIIGVAFLTTCAALRESAKCVTFDFIARAGKVYQYVSDDEGKFLVEKQTGKRVAKGRITTPEKSPTQCKNLLLPIKPVSKIDLKKYMGRWYGIAYAPAVYRTHTTDMLGDCDYPLVEYHSGTDKENAQYFEAQFFCLNKDLQSKTAGKTFKWCINRKFKEAVFGNPHRWSPDCHDSRKYLRYGYWIIAIDPNYQWSAISNPWRQETRILARKPRLSKQALEKIVTLLEQQGHDPCWLEISSYEQAGGHPRLCDYMKRISQSD